MRGRRLTEAARTLAGGAPDILAVALDVGYNSDEALTRAFRDQFGLTPEVLRARHLEGIELMQPIKMDETLLANLEPPSFENLNTLLVAGLSERYTTETCANIPAQWQRFAPHLVHDLEQVATGIRTSGGRSPRIRALRRRIRLAHRNRRPRDLDSDPQVM